MVRDRALGEKWSWFVHLESGGKAAALQILEAEGYTLGATQMFVKGKGLGEKQFVRP